MGWSLGFEEYKQDEFGQVSKNTSNTRRSLGFRKFEQGKGGRKEYE